MILVGFNEISPFGNRYEMHEIDGLDSQQVFVVKGPVDACCTLTRKGDDKVALQGGLKASLTLTCDRCLSLYDWEVDADVQILFEVESSDSWAVRDFEYNIPDLDTILLEEPIVDLVEVFRQQLYLALPMKNLCSEQCKGICSRCGFELNRGACGCGNENRLSPFAILSQLKQ